MWKTTAHLRHQCKSHWGPLAGLLTGLTFVVVQLTTAHVGDRCNRLGQIAEEQKQWPRAIQWYEAIEDGEQALPARLRTANAIAKQGKLDAAREYLHKTAADHPGNTHVIRIASVPTATPPSTSTR